MGVADLLAAAANAPLEPDSDEETKPPVEALAPSTDDLAAQKTEEEGEEEEGKAEEESDGLRQADYTRKTQALAEERKQLHAEIEREREEWSAKQEDLDEVQTWLQNLNDPDKAEYQLSRYFPQTIQMLRDKWIAEAGEESQLTERERAALRRVRDLELADKARKEDEDRAKTRTEKAKKAQATNDLRRKVAEWLPAAAKAAGLDEDEDTFNLIRNELSNGKYWQMKWDVNVLTTAAKVVAKAMKKAPPAAAAPKLPPSSKSTGHKAPTSAKVEKKAAKKDSVNYFRALRAKYDV